MSLPKGRTNNRNGRPPTGRALTEILMREMSKTVGEGDTRMTAKRATAVAVRDLLVTGKARLIGKKEIELKPMVYVELVKWFYAHVDGSKQEIQQDVKQIVEFVYPDEQDTDSAGEIAPGTD